MTETNTYQLHIPAESEKLPEVLSFLDRYLEEKGCSIRTQMQLDVAIEEVFVNIAHYAYPKNPGGAEMTMSFEQDSSGRDLVRIVFRDRGIPFDPLQHVDPDITLPAIERQIGGLGIFMVKKSMDEVYYTRENDHNVLTIIKYL